MRARYFVSSSAYLLKIASSPPVRMSALNDNDNGFFIWYFDRK